VLCRRPSLEHNDEHGACCATCRNGVLLYLGQCDLSILAVEADLNASRKQHEEQATDLNPKVGHRGESGIASLPISWTLGPSRNVRNVGPSRQDKVNSACSRARTGNVIVDLHGELQTYCRHLNNAQFHDDQVLIPLSHALNPSTMTKHQGTRTLDRRWC
jgi:hypothetical protein